MNLFQITGNKIQVTMQLDAQSLLSNPEEYVFLLSYRELLIMRAYLRQLARGRSFDDVCNKCDAEWHKPLIALSATIIAHPAYICTSRIVHESAYLYMQVASEGTGDKALRAASKLVDGMSAVSPVKHEAIKLRLIARIWRWMKEIWRKK